MIRIPGLQFLSAAFVAAALALQSDCPKSPLQQLPPKMPEAGEAVTANAANGGRVQSIAVNPTNRDNAIIAMQFGGLWKTYNAGKAWFRVYTLPAVYVTDVEYGAVRNNPPATRVVPARHLHAGGARRGGQADRKRVQQALFRRGSLRA